MKHCDYCGQNSEDKALECRKCGAPLLSNDKPDHEKAELAGIYKAEIQQIVNGVHPSIRRGDITAIVNLKRRYRSLGLEVY